MSTTVGETAADYLNFNLHLGLSITTILVGVLLGICLLLQFNKTEYKPVTYWMSVALISVFGTLITDNLTDHFGVPLIISSTVFAILLLGTFLLWHWKEKTLSIHAINTRARELFYWLAILMTFALGTAVGDWVSEELQWGYAQSGLIFAGLILLVTVTYYLFKVSSVLCFWLAYILTRPLGASLGDYLTQTADKGGLSLQSDYVNLVFLISIMGLVSYLTITQQKQGELASDD
jgi:uncharacterized membrane-anchored protein